MISPFVEEEAEAEITAVTAGRSGVRESGSKPTTTIRYGANGCLHFFFAQHSDNWTTSSRIPMRLFPVREPMYSGLQLEKGNASDT